MSDTLPVRTSSGPLPDDAVEPPSPRGPLSRLGVSGFGLARWQAQMLADLDAGRALRIAMVQSRTPLWPPWLGKTCYRQRCALGGRLLARHRHRRH